MLEVELIRNKEKVMKRLTEMVGHDRAGPKPCCSPCSPLGPLLGRSVWPGLASESILAEEQGEEEVMGSADHQQALETTVWLMRGPLAC